MMMTEYYIEKKCRTKLELLDSYNHSNIKVQEMTEQIGFPMNISLVTK